MGYLFFQIWVWIVASFILGWVAHWLLCCRSKGEEHREQTSANTTLGTKDDIEESIKVVAAEVDSVDESWKPQGFSAAPSDNDDLQRIKGIGPVIEETLNDLGIYQFKQIASWDENNISWVENFLAFPGRIKREDWVTQSKTLNEGAR